MFFQRDFSPLLNYREMTFSRNGSFNPARMGRGRKGETDRGFFPPNKLHDRPIERAFPLFGEKELLEKVVEERRKILSSFLWTIPFVACPVIRFSTEHSRRRRNGEDDVGGWIRNEKAGWKGERTRDASDPGGRIIS